MSCFLGQLGYSTFSGFFANMVGDEREKGKEEYEGSCPCGRASVFLPGAREEGRDLLLLISAFEPSFLSLGHTQARNGPRSYERGGGRA